MQSSRDPHDFLFGEVFRLPPGTREPDHYLLLGLPWFASGPDRIRRAATERLALIEACEADPRPGMAEACRKLRAEVEEAQRVLLDPGHRKQYDALLIGRSGAGSGGAAESGESSAEAPRRAPRAARAPSLPAGSMFAGRYRVMGRAREGALGEVLEALDRNLRQRVHLSVLWSEAAADPVRRRRIEQAMRDAARLEDPHIVRVDEVGEEGGRLYLRTRPPEGVPLTGWISPDRSWLPPHGQVRRIALDLCDALAAAHEAGVPHGALDVSRIFVPDDGPVQVVDFAVARAVADAEAGVPPPPPGDLRAEDRDALGMLLFLLLAGDVPDPDLSPARLAAALPPDTPHGLRRATVALLHPAPGRRPRDLAVVHRMIAGERGPARVRTAVAVVLVLAVVVAGGLLAALWPDAKPAAPPVTAEAWRLVSDRDYRQAIDLLRPALGKSPDDAAVRGALAAALEGLAHDAAGRGEAAEAQRRMVEAQELEPRADRARILAEFTRRARRALAAVLVAADRVQRDPAVSIDPRGAALAEIDIAGRSVDVADGPQSVPVPADEGRLAVPWSLRDVAGNRREGELDIDVDRTAPALTVLAPADGTLFPTGTVAVEVRVVDAHPGREIRVGEKRIGLVGEVASGTLELADGEHRLEVVAVDRAGNTAKATVGVVVDTRPPRLEPESERLVTPDGKVDVRGRVAGHGVALTLDGQPVALGADGSFSAPRLLTASGTLDLRARSANGLETEKRVTVILDGAAPRISCPWDRVGHDGRLLYGKREIERGVLGIPLRIEDESRVELQPSEGTVEGDFWMVPAREGRRTVTMVAVDEAGHRAAREFDLEGHGATPVLVVDCDVSDITNAEQAALRIDADAPVFLGEEPIQPGRRSVPLPEGHTTLVVSARDRWGNETRWTKPLDVDRTPPVLTLEGPEDRPIGRQEIVLRANEPLAAVTCAGRTVEPDDEVATLVVELGPGRRRLTAVARDLAGNETETTFPVRVENRVLSLDGSSALVVDLDADLAQFTVECWVRGFTPQTRMIVVSRGVDAGWAIAWSSVDTSLPYASFVSASRGFLALPVRRGWRWPTWTHLALTWDGERVSFYVDGSLRAVERTEGPPVPGGASLVVGGEPDGNGGVTSFFRGAIDDLRVSRVARYAGAFRPPRYHDVDDDTELLLRFDVTEEDGKVHPDSSGHGRNARVIGRPELVEEAR